MGIPYSKQINAAFDEVSPLVASTLEVLSTSQQISYLLAGIQVLTALLQLATVLALFALLITLNPDLVTERKELVTPVLKSLTAWMMAGSEARWYFKAFGWAFGCVWMVACAVAAYYYAVGAKEKVAQNVLELPLDGDES